MNIKKKAEELKKKYQTEIEKYKQIANYKEYQKKLKQWKEQQKSIKSRPKSKLDLLIERAKKSGLIDTRSKKYVVKINQVGIDCPHLKSKDDTSKCPIYYNMKIKQEYNKNNLHHLQQYNHFENPFEDKPRCKYGDECESYTRSEHGQDKHSISDECHMILYHHPPRTRQIKLSQNVNPMIVNETKEDNHGLYAPTEQEQNKYSVKWNKDKHVKNRQWMSTDGTNDGWLKLLIKEIIDNKYAYDLCLSCSKDDKCKHNVYESEFSILKKVDDKMTSDRHLMMNSPLNRAELLALMLYTGCFELCNH